MRLTGDTNAKRQLQRLAKRNKDVIRFLIRLARTNVTHRTFFRARDGHKYRLSLDLITGDLAVAPA